MSKIILYSRYNFYPSLRSNQIIHAQMPIMLNEINSVVMTSSNNTEFSSLNKSINLESYKLNKAVSQQYVNFNNMSLDTYEQIVGIDKIYNPRFTVSHYKAIGEQVIKLSETDTTVNILYLDNTFINDQKLVNENQKKDFLKNYLGDGIKNGVFSKNANYILISSVYYVSDNKFIFDMVDNKKFKNFVNEIDQHSDLPSILESQLKSNLITEEIHHKLITEYEIKQKSYDILESNSCSNLIYVKSFNKSIDPNDLDS